MRRDGRRFPEEGPGTGADPGVQEHASDQRREVGQASRRVSPEDATAPVQSDRARSAIPANSTGTILANSAGTTKAGKPRQRIAWTEEMNEIVMRCYYIATNLETDLTLYRANMYQLFRKYYPQLEVTEQRIADQRRAIMERKLLTEMTIEGIRSQVRRELEEQSENGGMNEPGGQEQTSGDTGAEMREGEQSEAGEGGQITESETEKEFRHALEENMIKYCGMDPTKRPNIPRQSTSVRLATIVATANKVLSDYSGMCESFVEMHTLVYCAAVTCVTLNGSKVRDSVANVTLGPRDAKDYKPRWMIRLESRIRTIRAKISKLVEYKSGKRSKKLMREVEKIRKDNYRHTKHGEFNEKVDEVIDTLKQRLTALAKRLRRYKKCSDRKEVNKLFKSREGSFYRRLQQQTNTFEGNWPTKHEIETYWRDVWSNKGSHEERAQWLLGEYNSATNIDNMKSEEVTLELYVRVVNNTHNWKSPGVDKLHNYWYKKFTALHHITVKFINQFLKNPQDIPYFLTTGITYLLPKNSTEISNVSKYRPITCLCTFYKIITSCVAEAIYDHCEANKIITENQKGCCRGSRGCKEQLVIDGVVMTQAYKKHRNIHIAYIDYRKAYDSVPHSWLLEVLTLYKINQNIRGFLGTVMKRWQTVLHLQTGSTCVQSGAIRISRGIFQGDALSPLWFCLALNPLSSILNRAEKGYNIRKGDNAGFQLSHLLYMDDIKLYSSTEQHLKQLLDITENFSRDIGMSFGLDKCRVRHIEQGKLKIRDHRLRSGDNIASMEEEEMYKYLGMHQSNGTDAKSVKEQVVAGLLKRVQSICKTLLHSKHIFKAINTYAIPLLTYSLGVIPWTDTDLAEIQRRLSKVLKEAGFHHPSSAKERLTLPRGEGGRGLADVLNLRNAQINNLKEYFIKKGEQSDLHRAIISADNSYSPLNLANEQHKLEIVSDQQKKEIWLGKPLHGRFAHELGQEHVDKTASNAWLIHGTLYPETEGFLVAIQDQVIPTNNYKKYILKDGTEDDRCRRCRSAVENVNHIISGCQFITQSDYKNRHDQVAKIIHQRLLQRHSLLKDQMPYYKYDPEPLAENDEARIYWDRGIITDKTIHHNRPDITVVFKKTKVAYLVDIAVPSTVNLLATYAEKVRKYQDLSVEIKHQWHLREVHVVPVVISATGVVPKSLSLALKTLDLPQNLNILLQKAAILGTCNTVRKFLNSH